MKREFCLFMVTIFNFQSWEETEGEQMVVLNNLPETWKLSHMSILLRGLQLLGVSSSVNRVASTID